MMMRAARPLDEKLVSDLRAHKPTVLAFLAAKRQSGVPPEWRDGVARLTAMAPLPGFAPGRWATLVADAQAFLDLWAGQASGLDWATEEIFGCHRHVPAARYDAAGLVMMLGGGRIVAMTSDHATIENTRGARLRHHRPLTAPKGERTVLWELGR